jgi:GNAT superfamily N-acetyltransferase
MTTTEFEIKPAEEKDVPVILSLIKELAEYEKLSHMVVATENGLREELFGERPVAESIIGFYQGVPVCFALFFHNFSTFLGQRGIYLEDLYVQPHMRGKGFGRALLVHLARLAVERNCGRLEWAVLDWNEPAIKFYRNLEAEPQDEWTIFRMTGDALKNLAS